MIINRLRLKPVTHILKPVAHILIKFGFPSSQSALKMEFL